MATTLNGIPVRNITAAVGVQQADFDEELSGVMGGGVLSFTHNKMTHSIGGHIVSGIDEHGALRQKRFVFTLDIGPGALPGNHALMNIIANVSGTRVTLQFCGNTFTGAAAGAIARDHDLPLSISPAATVYGTCCCLDNALEVIGSVSITPAGVITIRPGVINTTNWTAAAGAVIRPFSITYDTMKAW